MSLEKNSKRLVIDPGLMTAEPEVLLGADAVLVTHEHFDHFAPDRLRTALSENEELVVYTRFGAATRLKGITDRVDVVRGGEPSAPMASRSR